MIRGKNVRPSKVIRDPYPNPNGVAVDPYSELVVVTDVNRKSILMYDRLACSVRGEVVKPKRHIIGSTETFLGFLAGVALDPDRGDIYVVNNDIEDSVPVFNYEDDANARPKRVLLVPHRAWGVAISEKEVAVSIETFGVVFYPREASGCPEPSRSIFGPNSGMADPHGIILDEEREELIVANHGNYNPEGNNYSGENSTRLLGSSPVKISGNYLFPSISTYRISADGDVPPTRKIAGPSTNLSWPMGIALNKRSNEIVVANNGDDSIVFFDREDEGDVTPKRTIRGALTGLRRPVSVQVDEKNDELWVANFDDHTVLVFNLTDEGNVPPKRVIRTAPQGAPNVGFANPMAATYDTRRNEWIIGNCVTQPRILIFNPSSQGVASPSRLIDGGRSKLTRTVHGIAYNPRTDEVIVAAPMAAAILIFDAEKWGESRPKRIIQGPDTALVFPHVANVDVEREEILVGDQGRGGVLVFSMSASGNVKPSRSILGPNTRLDYVTGVGAVTEEDLIVVASTDMGRAPNAKTGIFMYNRSSNGDVKPVREITGPNTGIKSYPWTLAVHRGHIFVAVSNMNYLPCYDVNRCIPNRGLKGSPWVAEGFIGVWSLRDNGDVPPRLKINGPLSEIGAPTSLALNPNDGEVLVGDSIKNGCYVFRVIDFLREL
ncbi:MAG: hypothetical protein NZ920_05680 [Aigarchaeota archaeon]|nr:hypothetical protein [Aigarchaeota archaeon]